MTAGILSLGAPNVLQCRHRQLHHRLGSFGLRGSEASLAT